MNILDIIILIFSIPVIISGYKKGFIRQVITIIGLLVGSWIASGLGDNVGEWFMPLTKSSSNPQGMASLMGFATVLVAVLLIFWLAGRIVEKIILIVVPDFVNKILGVLLSIANGILLLCVLYLIFELLNKIYFFPDLMEVVESSLFYPIIESTAKTLLPNILNFLL
jgi:membrane protein required for colicin V production